VRSELEQGSERDQQPRRPGGEQGEGERARSEDDHLRARKRRGQELPHGFRGPGCEDHGHGRSRAREAEALQEDLAGQAAVRGSERSARRELGAAGGMADELQVREVEAGEGQHREDGTPQQLERASVGPQELVLQRNHPRVGLLRIGVGMGLAQTPRRCRELGLGPCARHSRREPGDRPQEVRAAVGPAPVVLQEQRGYGLGGRVRQHEGGRQDPDHAVRLLVEEHGAPDEPLVAAEPRLPQAVAEHHDLLRVGMTVRRLQEPALRGPDTRTSKASAVTREPRRRCASPPACKETPQDARATSRPAP
jgi:hypothetical protein